jgi:MOSC domain-containing protein YiiM
VAVRGVNLEGDEQADRTVHGGLDKAVYAYALEDKIWWQTEIGRVLEHGEFGENLVTEGIDVTGALVGERWQVGSTLLEVSEPRVPCWRFAVRMNNDAFLRHFTQAGRPGAYLRIIEEGELGAGDEIRIPERPDHGLSIGDIFRIYTRDRHEVADLLAVPQVSEGWRLWAEARIRSQRERE